MRIRFINVALTTFIVLEKEQIWIINPIFIENGTDPQGELCYGNKVFVFLQYNGYIYTSEDGINWTCTFTPSGFEEAGTVLVYDNKEKHYIRINTRDLKSKKYKDNPAKIHLRQYLQIYFK